MKQFNIDLVIDSQIFYQYQMVLIKQEYIERQKEQKLPIICSECPGWICYAEKLCDSKVIDYMSKVKSVQQLASEYIKKYIKMEKGLGFQQIASIQVTPCYDKKLEAFRYKLDQDLNDIDLVLTTKEIQELIQMDDYTKYDYHNKIEKFKDVLIDGNEVVDLLEILDKECYMEINKERNMIVDNNQDITSNGYIFNIVNMIGKECYRDRGKECYGDSDDQLVIEEKKGRNNDMMEYSVNRKDGEQLLMLAKMYGFRNIQNLMRGLKKGIITKWTYIEVMSCPGGCINGGGQLKPIQKTVKGRQIIEPIKQLMVGGKKVLDQQDKQKIVEAMQKVEQKMEQKVDYKGQFKHVGDQGLVNAQSIKW